MPANFNPVFPLTPVTTFPAAAITSANTAKDGTGTVHLIFTAGADGGRIDYIKVRALGTNVATVMRVFVNNGSANTTAANNALFMERTIAATTLSEVAELADTVIPMNISLLATHRIYVVIGTAVAAGLMPTGVGGNY